MKKRLAEENLPVMNSVSHIVPLFIGNAAKCKEVSDTMFREFGIYVQPINYPTVPRGQELLRLSPGPFHTLEKIEESISAAKQVWSRFGLTTYHDIQKKSKEENYQ
jgi:5-aminolevulinate synthase